MARSRYANSRNHAIRHHQDGLAIADRIAGAMLLTVLIGGMYGMVAYANARDAREFCNSHASVPTRPGDGDDTPQQVRTLDYLDALPPSA